jgi:hypothetical protein
MSKQLLVAAGLVSLFAIQAFAREESLLARVTVYWSTGIAKCDCAHATGARLRVGHCAVDPKKIPYGSKVYFPDGPCVAVDTGPAVIDRKAARLSGRNRRERGALVVDRFFETKQQALAWERAHPHFMTVRVVSPRSHSEPVEQWQPNATHVAETTTTPPRPSPTIRHREDHSAMAVAFEMPQRSLLSAPPSYHRRRFAAVANDDTAILPPDRTVYDFV